MGNELKAGFAKTQDETIKKQAAGLNLYKSTEPFGPRTRCMSSSLDPAVPVSEYSLFQMLDER